MGMSIGDWVIVLVAVAFGGGLTLRMLLSIKLEKKDLPNNDPPDYPIL